MSKLSVYPQDIDKFIRRVDETGDGLGDYVMADDVNALQDSIIAIQESLGLNPQGSFTDISGRLDTIASSGSNGFMGPGRLIFYTGKVNEVNGSTSIIESARHFVPYSTVILSSNILESNSQTALQNLIKEVKSISNTKFYIEINSGLFSSGTSVEQELVDMISLKLVDIDGIGIDGIYLNNFGYDKGTKRSIQNKIINNVRAKEYKLMVSATKIDDIFSEDNSDGMNTENLHSLVGSGDIVLYRDFAYIGNELVTISKTRREIETLIAYRVSKNIKIFAYTELSSYDIQRYNYAYGLATIFSLDGFYSSQSSVQSTIHKSYPILPISVNTYDANPYIRYHDDKMTRETSGGTLTLDVLEETYIFDNVVIPLKYIDFSDGEGIDASLLKGELSSNVSINVISRINSSDEGHKILPKSINFNGSGGELIKAINLTTMKPDAEKISKDAIEEMNIYDIVGIVDAAVTEAMAQNLGDLLMSGEYSAVLQSLTANFISAMNAYVEKLIADEADITWLNAGIIRTGYIVPDIIDVNTITSDKLTIHANGGSNKWSGTIVSKESNIPIAQPHPSMVLGKDIIKRVEFTEGRGNFLISTTPTFMNSTTRYIALWETHVFCDRRFTSPQLSFTSSTPASLYVNEAILVSSNLNEPNPYSMELLSGWNKIQVVQEHIDQPEVNFNLGIKLSAEALKTEKGNPTGIIRVDAYADKFTQIVGDYIKTGTIELEHLEADTLNAKNIKTGTLDAETKITVGGGVVLDGEAGLILDGGTGIFVKGQQSIKIEEGTVVVDDGSIERVILGHYENEKFGLKVTMDEVEGQDAQSITLDKRGLQTSTGNFAINADGSIDLIGKITATEGHFLGKIGVGKEIIEGTQEPVIMIDGSSETDPEIRISVESSSVEYTDGNGEIKTIEVPGGYVRTNKEGIQVSEDGFNWVTKLHAKGLTVGNTDIGDGVITTDKINVKELNAGLINAGLINAMEAYIENLTATNGDFENLLADLIVAKSIDTTNISVYSEARDGSDNTGFLFIDSGGMLVSSMVKEIGIANSETLVFDPLASIEGKSTYKSLNVDWVIDKDNPTLITLRRKLDREIVTPTGPWYSLNSKQGRINVNSNVLLEEGIHLVDHTIEADYRYYKGIPLNAHLVKVDRAGIKVSPDGGRSWNNKLTGAGLSVGLADVVEIYASSIRTSALDVGTSINVAGLVHIDGSSGILVDGAAGAGITISEGSLLVKEGSLDRIRLGKLAPNSYGLEVLTDQESITLDRTGLYTSNGNFKINTDGTISAIDGDFRGSIRTSEAIFGSELADHIKVDDKGIVLNSGSIVDNRDLNYQALKIDSSGIVANSGTIGGMNIIPIIDSIGEELRVIGSRLDAISGGFSIDKDNIEVRGQEAVTIYSGSLVVKENDKTYLTLGSLPSYKYGMKIDLYKNQVDTNNYIQLDQDGLRAWNSKLGLNTLDINSDGNISIVGHIDAKTGTLGDLSVSGFMEIATSGEIRAGSYVRLDSAGLVGPSFTLNEAGIKATGGTIGGWSINSNSISSGNLALNQSTEQITVPGVVIGKYDSSNYGIKAGDTILNSYGISGTGYYLNEQGIIATAGSISGWEIKDYKLSRGLLEINSASELIKISDQLLIGKYDNTNYGLKAGTVVLNKTGLTGVDFSLDSSGIKATGGLIGGWSINEGRISSGMINLDNSRKSIWIGSDIDSANIRLNNDGSAKLGVLEINKVVNSVTYPLYSSAFKIDGSGNATLEGVIRAKSGWFGHENGVKINATGLKAGSVNLTQTGILVGSTLAITESGLYLADNTSSIRLGNSFLADKDGIVTTAGKIASWTIGTDILSSGSVALDSKLEQIRISDEIILGKYDTTSGLSYGLKAGATTLNKTGIHANEGDIGGWIISETSISSTRYDLSTKLTNGSIVIQNTTNPLNPIDMIGLYSDGSAKLGLMNVDRYGYISSPDFIIDNTGATFSGSLNAAGGTFIGELVAASGTFSGELSAVTGSIGGWSIGLSKLSASNISIDSSGKILMGHNQEISLSSSSGITIATNKIIMGLDGSFKATSADITGSITTDRLTATGGTISNLNILEDVRAGDVLLNNTGITGPGFSLISSGLKVDQGKIGNWLVTGNAIQAGGIILDATTGLEKISLGENIILNTDGSANIGVLTVSQSGGISSTNFNISDIGDASFTGTINASSGAITGSLTVGSNITIDGSTSSIKVNTDDVVLDSRGITAKAGVFGTATNGVKVTSSGLEILGHGTIKNQFVTINSSSISAGDATLGVKGLTIDGISSSINLNNKFIVNNLGHLTASSGNIAGWVISPDGTSLANANVKLDSSGEIVLGLNEEIVLSSTSGINANNKFTVNLAGKLIATDAVVTGEINALSGYFGNLANGVEVNNYGMKVVGNGSIKNNNTSINKDTIIVSNSSQVEIIRLGLLSDETTYGLSGVGFKLNNNGLSLTGASNININDKFKVNSNGLMTATGAIISGEITATSGSFTGAVTVSPTGSFGVANKVLINSNGIDIRSGNITLGENFSVTNEGNLTASSANITGTIVATQGKIGEWSIYNGAIIDRVEYPRVLITKEAIKINSGELAETNEITLGQYDPADPTKYGLKAGNTILDSTGIVAKSGSVGGIVIGENYLQSRDFSSGSTGFKLYSDNGSGRILAKDVELYGDIHADSGTFGKGSGGITANSTGIFNGTAVGAADSSFWISSLNGDAHFKGSVSISHDSVIDKGNLVIQSGSIIAGNPFGAHARMSMMNDVDGGEICATTSTGEYIFKANKNGAYFKGDITATTGKILGNLSVGSSGSIYIDGRNNTELGITPGIYLYDFMSSTSYEYPTLAQFPSPGKLNTTYIALDTNKKYNWNAITYVENTESRVVRLNNSGLYISKDGGYTYDPAVTGGGINANAINDGVLNITDSGSGASGISISQWNSSSNEYVENVSITPSGINVLNGAITVYSETNGEVLIGGGYLRVKGLDMGVVTSNNFIANGNFAMVSEKFGLKQNNKQEIFLGKAQSSGGAVSNPTYHYAGWPDYGDRNPHSVYTYDLNPDGTINNYDPTDLSDPNHPKIARVSFNPQWVAVHPITKHGIVPNDADNFISIVDPDSGQIVKHLKAWKGGLFGADFIPDQSEHSMLKDDKGVPLTRGSRMIACGDDIDRKRGPWDMVVFDTSSPNPDDWKMIGCISVGEFPSKVICDDKGYAYVTVSLDMAIYKIDIANLRVEKILNATDPRGMAVSPLGIAISRDYNIVYVAGVVTDAIYEIPADFETPFDQCRMFSVCPYPGNRGIPHDIHVLSDGRLTCSSSSITDGYISILDLSKPTEEYTSVPIGMVNGSPRMMITDATDTWIDGTMDGEGGLVGTDGTEKMKLAYPEGITQEQKDDWNFLSTTTNRPHPDPNIKIIYATITNRCMMSVLDYSSGELVEIARIPAGSNPSGVDIVVERDELGNITKHKLFVAMHHFHTYPLGANKIWGYRTSDNYYVTDDLFDTGQSYYHYNPSGILIFDDGPNIGRYVWVANRATNEVVVIDALDWKNQEKWVRIKDVGNKPYEMKALSDNSKIFVSNDDSDNKYEPDFVTIIDRATRTIDGRIYVGDNPIGLEIKDDTYLYVACNGMNAVQKINIATRRVIDTQHMAGNPRHLKLVGNKLYVTCSDTNTICCIDAISLDVIKEFNIDGSIYEINFPSQMEMVGSKLYVTNKSSDHVVIIDTVTNTLSSTVIRVGSTPNAIKYNPVKNLLYVANAGEGSLCIIDPDTDEIVEWSMTGDNPEYIAVTSDGENFYVSAHGPEDIAAYGEGPFTGDAYLDNNGSTHKYGSSYWVPSRSEWVRGSDKTLTSFSSVEFWPNAELQGKKGYSHLTVLGMFDSFAQIEQDVYPMLNASDGSSEFTIETIELEESRPLKLKEAVADFRGVIGKEYSRISITDKFDHSKRYVEGSDYVVDYEAGTIKIEGINVPPSRYRSNTGVLNGVTKIPMAQGGYRYNTIEVYPLNQVEGKYVENVDYTIDRINNMISRTTESKIQSGVAVSILYRHLLHARYYYHPHKRNYEDVVLSADLFWKWPRPENQWVKMQIDELVPKFIMVDNDQIDTFIPSYDYGKGDELGLYYEPSLPTHENAPLMTIRKNIPEYKGLSYSSMSNRATSASMVSSASAISGSIDTIKTGQSVVILPSGKQHVTMDIGSIYYINRVSIDHGTGVGLINNSKVEISTDGITWHIVRTKSSSDRFFDITFPSTFDGEQYHIAKRIRYIRVSAEGLTTDALAQNQFKQIKIMGDWKVSTGYRFSSNTIWDSEGKRERYVPLSGLLPKRFDDPTLPTDPFAANIRPNQKVRYRAYYTSPTGTHDRIGEVEVYNLLTGEQYNGINARDTTTAKTYEELGLPLPVGDVQYDFAFDYMKNILWRLEGSKIAEEEEVQVIYRFLQEDLSTLPLCISYKDPATGEEDPSLQASVAETDTTGAWVEWEFENDYRCDWYIGWIADIGLGNIDVYLDGEIVHSLSQMATKVERFSQLTQDLKPGHHKIRLVQKQGRVNFDIIKLEDYQLLNRASTTVASPSTNPVELFTWFPSKITAEKARKYIGRGTQILSGAYDNPRTDKETRLPNNQVPIKYRARFVSSLEGRGAPIPDYGSYGGEAGGDFAFESGSVMITDVTMEYGVNPTYWRMAPSADQYPGFMVESWDESDPTHTGIQGHHLAKGSVSSDKIKSFSLTDEHIANNARIQENKLDLDYATHPHSNKITLDSISGWGANGSSTSMARADHIHSELSTGTFTQNVSMKKGLTVHGTLKELGKHEMVHRRPLYGIAGDLQMQTNSHAWELITTHYSPFGYAMPAVKEGATRYYRMYAIYGDNILEADNVRTKVRLRDKVTSEIIHEWTLDPTFANANGKRDLFSEYFQTNNLNNVDIELTIQNNNGTYTGLDKEVGMEWLELMAYDVYEEANS